MLKHTFLLFLGVSLLFVNQAIGQEKKEFDLDVNYDENRVPAYTLPSLLTSVEGEEISTIEAWETHRRPQILSLFSTLIYGRIPVPESPLEITHDVIHSDPHFMKKKAIRKDILIRFRNEKGEAEMVIVMFVPADANGPAPAFMIHSFDDTRSNKIDVHPQHPDQLRNGWPLGAILDRGYAFIAVYQRDLVGHNEVQFERGIHPLFFKEGQSFPHADEWGVIGAVAWGAMQALDYLETDLDVDHNKVVIMGHSKMGKTALWTAAQDQRFALAISAQSGCAGAALWRRRSGETLAKMVTRFPYWLSRNAWKFVNQEDDLPVDQHMLIGLIAPRPVYVASGEEDTWADPRGEYLSAYHAGEVYQLYGKKSLASPDLPPIGAPIIESQVGYHIRAGGHSVEPYDWQRFLDFADHHLMKN